MGSLVGATGVSVRYGTVFFFVIRKITTIYFIRFITKAFNRKTIKNESNRMFRKAE